MKAQCNRLFWTICGIVAVAMFMLPPEWYRAAFCAVALAACLGIEATKQ